MNTEFDDNELKELLQISRGEFPQGDVTEDNVMRSVHTIERKRQKIAKYRRYGWISLAAACVLLLLFSLMNRVSLSISDFNSDPQYLIIILIVGSVVTFLMDSLSDDNGELKSHKMKQYMLSVKTPEKYR